MTATQAAEAIQRGMREIFTQAHFALCPMADGGEGTVDTFLERGARRCSAQVRDPLGRCVEAVFAMQGKAAILEMSAASGLQLLQKDQYDPMHADTYGTGEMLQAASQAGATRVILGIGGSATSDCGTGLLRALGVRFLDESGSELSRDLTSYERLASIDVSGIDERVVQLELLVAGDVDNPLTGAHGAARTYAGQKGAGEAQIAVLDGVAARIADVAARTLGRDERNARGAGAAGGLGFALIAFLRARLQPGVRLIAREAGLEELLYGADLCATGEGKIDEQTLHGKTVYGVAELARQAKVPVVAFGGAIDAAACERLEAPGLAVRPIAPDATPLEESMRDAARFLEEAARAYAVEFQAQQAR